MKRLIQRKRFTRLPRIFTKGLGAFLILALGLPTSSVHALRPVNAGLEDSPVQLALQAALESEKSGRKGDLLAEHLPELLEAVEQFFSAKKIRTVETAFVSAVKGILDFDNVVLYLARPSQARPGQYELLSQIRELDGTSAAAEWSLATHEKEWALEQAEGKEPEELADLLLKNRSVLPPDKIDGERLKKDLELYGKNAEDVYYVVLKSSAGIPLGLIFVGNLKTGRPLFHDESSRIQVGKVLETLGTGALFSLEIARSHEQLKNFEKLGKDVEQLRGTIHDLKNALSPIVMGSQFFQMASPPNSPFLPVFTRLYEMSLALNESSEDVGNRMRSRFTPYGVVSPADPHGMISLTSPLVGSGTKTSDLENLFHQVSVDLLAAVQAEDLRAVQKITRGPRASNGNEKLREILDYWESLASTAIASRRDLQDDNETLRYALQGIRKGIENLQRRVIELEGDLPQGFPEDEREMVVDMKSQLEMAKGTLTILSGWLSEERPDLEKPAPQELSRIFRIVVNSHRFVTAAKPGQWMVDYDASGMDNVLISAETADVLFHTFNELLRNTHPDKYGQKKEQARVTVQARYDFSQWQGRLTVHVRDNGIGIPEQFQPLLFEPGNRLDRLDTVGTNGTGIGLSSAKRRLQELGGDLKFVPPPPGEKGAEFVFYLPIKPVEDGTVSAGAGSVANPVLTEPVAVAPVVVSAGLEEGPVHVRYKNLDASFEEILAFSRRYLVRSYTLYRDNDKEDPMISRLGYPDNPPLPWDATDLIEHDLLLFLGEWARDTRYYILITEQPGLVGKIWADIVPMKAGGLEEKNVMMFGRELGRRFSGLRLLAEREPRVIVDEGDPFDALTRAIQQGEIIHFYGGLEEGRVLKNLIHASGIQVAFLRHDLASPADQRSLWKILASFGIPADVLSTGLEELYRSLELGQAA